MNRDLFDRNDWWLVSDPLYDNDDSNLIVACKMDNTSVLLSSKAWDFKKFINSLGPANTGARILGDLFPAGAATGAALGALAAAISEKPTGYYDNHGKCLQRGQVRRSDLDEIGLLLKNPRYRGSTAIGGVR